MKKGIGSLTKLIGGHREAAEDMVVMGLVRSPDAIDDSE